MKGQELLNGDVRVDPPEAGSAREARVLIPVSRLSQFEKDVFNDIASHYADSHEAYYIFLHIREAWEKFKGTRR